MTHDVKVNLGKVGAALGVMVVLLGGLWSIFTTMADARDAKAASSRAEAAAASAARGAQEAKDLAAAYAQAAKDLANENAKELVRALQEGMGRLNDKVDLVTQRIARMEGDVASLLREFQEPRASVKALQDARAAALPPPPTR